MMKSEDAKRKFDYLLNQVHINSTIMGYTNSRIMNKVLINSSSIMTLLQNPTKTSKSRVSKSLKHHVKIEAAAIPCKLFDKLLKPQQICANNLHLYKL